MTKDQKKQTAAQRLFAMYVKEISSKIIKKYGKSLSTYEEVKNTWRYTIPYSAEIEDYLILKTRIYIITLDSRNPDSKNPQFLKALTTLMADFLSPYTMRISDTCLRKTAKEALRKKLYDEFPYIQNIIERQEKSNYEKNKNRINRIHVKTKSSSNSIKSFADYKCQYSLFVAPKHKIR